MIFSTINLIVVLSPMSSTSDENSSLARTNQETQLTKKLLLLMALVSLVLMVKAV